jgi:hypothetical protein
MIRLLWRRKLALSHLVIRCPFTFAKPQISFDGRFKDIAGDLMVLWYGTFTPNKREKTVPLVNVHFRTVDPYGSLGAFYSVPMGLPYLSYFQIGTVWRAGSISTDTALEPLYELSVDFHPKRWRFVTASEVGLTSDSSPYKLPTSANTWLVEFRTSKKGQTVLVPCVELLIRLYGRSSETSRILTTYPWEEVQTRFFYDRKELWPENVVKLQPTVRQSEAVFLSHLRHSEYAQVCSQKLYADLEAAFTNTRDSNQTFGNLQVAPWFFGPARIKGSGYWINGGNTFLCLRLSGASEPDGPELEVHRPNYSTDARGPSDEDDGSVFIKRPTKTLPLDQKAVLTNDFAPDPDTGTHILLNESFQVLGKARRISVYLQNKPGERGKKILPTSETEVLSAGDPGSRGSGIGKAEIVDVEPWESSGVLVDVWLALCQLKASFPTVIDRVEWLTLDNQRGTEAPAKLVPIKEFDEDDDVTPDQRNWVYLDPKRKILRGVQILRVVCGERHFYLFEVQRRPTKNGSTDDQPAEQKAQGFFIELSLPPNYARTEIKKVLGLIRQSEGVVRNIRGSLSHPCRSFNHSKNALDDILYVNCMKKNLQKLGVTFPKTEQPARARGVVDPAPNS